MDLLEIACATPLLGLDVWEQVHDFRYQIRRINDIQSWLPVVQ